MVGIECIKLLSLGQYFCETSQAARVQFEQDLLMQAHYIYYTFSFTAFRPCSQVGGAKKDMGAKLGDKISVIPATVEAGTEDSHFQSLSQIVYFCLLTVVRVDPCLKLSMLCQCYSRVK